MKTILAATLTVLMSQSVSAKPATSRWSQEVSNFQQALNLFQRAAESCGPATCKQSRCEVVFKGEEKSERIACEISTDKAALTKKS